MVIRGRRRLLLGAWWVVARGMVGWVLGGVGNRGVRADSPVGSNVVCHHVGGDGRKRPAHGPMPRVHIHLHTHTHTGMTGFPKAPLSIMTRSSTNSEHKAKT